ncbi:pantoate kinase [Methanolobus halotolerans]|uniref:Pantoate kinase n=1 Tax=Methanolobus halotolerans TaxID=2052935 RepID=A0A4E0QDA1_9EURY|nr:pantoate kinase [Methanolobus halotolerans]TGC11351.1 pantothenate kinase [Methanolobus halotolerans]
MPSRSTASAKAFAPAHITGFFEVHDHNDPLRKGSTGCGIVLDTGIQTTVTCGEDIEETVVSLNDVKVEGLTIRTVIGTLTNRPVKIESKAEIPIESGMGASGAGALGTAYALNSALRLDLTSSKLDQVAHIAEVKNRSGLGDVAAQSLGGVVIRKTPGAPGIGTYDRIPVGKQDIWCIVLGQLSTSSVLSSRETVESINQAGRSAMKRLMRRNTLENFMLCSRDFSIETGLANDKIVDVIEAVESSGGLASQAMLGNTVFAIAQRPEDNATGIIDILSEFGNVLHYRIRTGSVEPL